MLDGVPLRTFVRAPQTILDAFEMGAAHEALVHLVHDEERWTFADVRRRSLSLARELHSSFGVRPGDRVAIAMRNLPEFIVSFWGAALTGAIVVPLNSWWTGPELNYALQDAGAVVAFMDDERQERVIADGRPLGVQLVSVRARLDGADALFDELVDGAAVESSAIARLGPDDPVTILYTSGTTGRPKGALGTNRAAIANIWNMAFVASRESIIGGRAAGPSRQTGHLGGAAALPHRRGGVDHRESDRGHEDRAHAQVGRRRRAATGGAGARDRLRRCTGDRPPGHRVPGPSNTSTSTSARSRWAAPRCRPICP